MKTNRMALIAIVLAFAIATASAQNSPTGSPTPHASGKAQGADVLWYGKAPPGWGGGVADMQLIASGVGWAKGVGRLYWTIDNGNHWIEITPPLTRSQERIASVSFADTRRGWILLSYPDETESSSRFQLGYTADAGATWFEQDVNVPKMFRSGSVPDYSGEGSVAFADSLHGWLDLAIDSSQAFELGMLIVTADGGKTWHEAEGDPAIDAEITLVTPNEGWLAGGPGSSDLYGTRDGGKTFEHVQLTAPPKVAPGDADACYGAPTFIDRNRGFVPVTYSFGRDVGLGGNGAKSAAVLFATEDGGRSWKTDRMLLNLAEINGVMPSAMSIADSTWVTANVESTGPKLTTLAKASRMNANGWRYTTASKISFAAKDEGWIIVWPNQLESTVNGGATWTNITPGSKPHVIHPLNEPAR
jgi:hypothetical protein